MTLRAGRVGAAVLCLLAALLGTCQGAAPTCDIKWDNPCLASLLHEKYYDCSHIGPETHYCTFAAISGEFPLIQSGACLPTNCTESRLNNMLATLADCPQLPEAGFKAAWDEVCKILFKTNSTQACEGLEPGAYTQINEAWEKLHAVVSAPTVESSVHCGDNKLDSFRTGAVVMIVLSSVILVICLVAAFVDYRELQRSNLNDPEVAALIGSANGGHLQQKDYADEDIGLGGARRHGLGYKLLMAFSPRHNLDALLRNEPSRSISCLEGLRTLSMFLIIEAHTTELQGFAGGDYPQEPLAYEAKTTQAFTEGGAFAVDTFFFISGLLQIYTLVRKIERTNKKSFPAHVFFFLRYMRLSALYGFCIGLYLLTPYMGSGPVWYRMAEDVETCYKNWWTNMLYINNFYPKEFSDGCMSWSWYLANDTQFFVLGLVVLFLYLQNHKAGLVMATLLALTGFASTYGVVMSEHIVSNKPQFQNDYYDKPWTRITSFGAGCICAMYLVTKPTLRLTKAVRWLLLLLAIATAAVVIYSRHLDFEPFDTYPNMSVAEFGTYLAFGRVAWSLALAVVVILCSTGNGDGVNKFLSLTMWQPLGKLTFGAYLTHPALIRIHNYATYNNIHPGTINFIFSYLGTLLLSYVCATILWVAIESPSANLIKLLMDGKKK